MSDQSLFLLQTRFAETASAIAKVQDLYGSGDHLVLMGEAALFVSTEDLAQFDNISILATDAAMLLEPLPDVIKVLDYTQFAELILQFTRCITFK